MDLETGDQKPIPISVQIENHEMMEAPNYPKPCKTSVKSEDGKERIQIVPESILFKFESYDVETSDQKPLSDARAFVKDDLHTKLSPDDFEEGGADLDRLVEEEMDKGGDSDEGANLDLNGECVDIKEEDVWFQRAKKYSKDAMIRKMSSKIVALKNSNREYQRRIKNLRETKNKMQKANQARKTPKEETVKCWVRDYIKAHRSPAWANFIMESNSEGPIKKRVTKNFSEQEVLKAIGLRRISKKAYNYMRDNGLCPLPGKSTLITWVKENPQWGIPTIGEYVRPTVSKKKGPKKRVRKEDVDAEPGSGVNPCGRCGENNTTRAKLNEHLAQVHGDESARELQCKVCDKWLGSKENMAGHRNMHMDVKPFKCTFCEKSYRNPWNMHAHRKEKHAEEWKAEKEKHGVHAGRPNSKPCTKCDMSFPFLSELFQHLAEIHQDVESKELQCTNCDKWLGSKLKLQNHMRIHTGERPFSCDFCPKTFFSENSLYGHRRDSHREEWEANKDQIEERNRAEGRRKQVAAWARRKGVSATEGIKGEAILDEATGMVSLISSKCDFCEGVYETKKRMLAHQKEVHGWELQERQMNRKRNVDEWISANPCALCGMDFPLQSALNEHLAQVHDDSLAKELQCADCKKWYGSKIMLNNHMRTHTGERPFKCDFCPKNFATNKNMGAHRKEMHHEEWEANKGQIMARNIALTTAKRKRGNSDVAILDEATGMMYD